jgi:carbon monoxide dehydrogenase subunit G
LVEIENAFTVGTPVEDLWRYLLDVERIAPCMPGAELTEIVDDHTWKGLLHMKFGPVALSFAGTVTMQDRDDTAHRVTLRAQGMEQKGKGAANATVTSWLEPAEDGRSSVHMKADITLTGAAAQLSRGLIPEVSRKLTQQFADCLEDTLNAEAAAGAAAAGVPGETPAVAPAPAAAKPVGGIGLGLAAIWSLIVNFFKRLLGGGRRAGA